MPNAHVARTRKLFSRDWACIAQDNERFCAPEIDDSKWRRLDLPHDWSVEQPFDKDAVSRNRGGFLPGAAVWYRKTFDAPADWSGKQVALEFEGVYMDSRVWLNGRPLGHRPNGYIGFEYDLTPHLTIGGPNVVAVRADNSRQPNSRWYSGTGVYRDAWLTVTGPVHVAHWGTYVTTPRVSAESAEVRVRTTVVNSTRSEAPVTLETELIDADGSGVARGERKQTIPPGESVEFDERLTVDRPRLWSPDEPNLYRAVTRVRLGDDVRDDFVTPFGIREFRFDVDKGFFLNGANMKLKGVNEHHDGGCVGAAVPRGVWKRRLGLLKDMGCNALRLAHNPHSPVLLDLCDEMGFLVVDEVFDEWRRGKHADTPYCYHRYFDQWALTDLRDQLRRDRNHPCVILWSMGNEIPERGEEDGVETLRMLADATHREDPTRPVTCGTNHMGEANASGFADAQDVVGYNGGPDGAYLYEPDHKRCPERKIFGSEVPHTFATRGVYRTRTHCLTRIDFCDVPWVPDLTKEEVFTEFPPYYESSYDNSFIRTCIRFTWGLVEKFDFLAGEFRWTGFDYLGESFGWPARSNNFGVLDTCGFPKDPYYFYRSRWSKEPTLHILPHWNWPGREGVVIPVWAYTNCERVELFLDDRSLGEQELAGRDHLSWDVPYARGILRARGEMADGRIVEETVETAGAPARVSLEADRPWLEADGRDVVHVTARILDDKGRFVPDAENELLFRIEGEGVLIGVDNGDPVDHECLKSPRRRAFGGLCLAIAQSTRRPGALRLEASSEGLACDAITVRADKTRE